MIDFSILSFVVDSNIREWCIIIKWGAIIGSNDHWEDASHFYNWFLFVRVDKAMMLKSLGYIAHIK